MAKQLLEGTLEEQCAFLYDLALSKMEDGNYTGALYALREVAKYRPEYRDVPVLLVQLKARKREQRRLILVGLGAGVLAAVGARMAGVTHDLLLIGAGALGLVSGYLGYTGLRQATGAFSFKSSAGLSRPRNISTDAAT